MLTSKKTQFTQTVSFDEKSWVLIHQMAEEIGGSVSGTLRQLIRQEAARRKNEEHFKKRRRGGSFPPSKILQQRFKKGTSISNHGGFKK
jgi:hypothetical protein